MTFRRQVRPLLLPARPRVVCRHLGQLSLVLAALLAVPSLFAAFTGDAGLAWRLLVAAQLPALALGLCARLAPGDRPLQTNEALIVAALAFVLAATLLTYPLRAGGLGALDAWFEAVSAVTTTGLTMAADPENEPPAFLFCRAWGQWFGGLGMVVLSLALAQGRVVDMRRLAGAAGEEEDPSQGIRRHARHVLAVYCLLTLLGLALVGLSGPSPFETLVHTLSAISTGGFSGFSDNVAALGRPAQFVLLGVAFLGAVPLHLYTHGRGQGAGALLRDPETRALAAAVVLVALLLWLLGGLAPADALLQGVSAQTGTGFSTLDVAGLDPGSKGVLILSMLSGGGVGSTSGGIKLLRLLVLLRVVQLAVLRAQLPRHAVVQPSLGGRVLESAQVEHALVLTLLYLGLVVFSWLPFLVAGHDPLNALFDVVSATATVGLSAGVAAPDLASGLKLVLTLDMLAGRVEVLALLVLLYPGSWYKS